MSAGLSCIGLEPVQDLGLILAVRGLRPGFEAGGSAWRPQSARPGLGPNTASGRSGCRGCRASPVLGFDGPCCCPAVCRWRHPASWPAPWLWRCWSWIPIFKADGQGQELAQRVPAQVVFFDQLLHVLGAEPPAPVSVQAAAAGRAGRWTASWRGAQLHDGEQVGQVVAQDVAGGADGVEAAITRSSV